MPCLSGTYNAGVGPLVQVAIAAPGTVATASASTNQPTVSVFTGLLDTGATLTCISPAVAQVLGLPAIGKRLMASATHAVPTNVYLVDLVFPFGPTSFVMAAKQVMEWAAPAPPGQAPPYQLLIGRDIICQGVLTMSFDGRFTFSL